MIQNVCTLKDPAGLHARLAAKITGWKIDVKPQSQFEVPLEGLEGIDINGEL